VGREIPTCGQYGPLVEPHDSRWSRCNRTVGHEGPHRKYDKWTFKVLAEWTDENVPHRKART
jgi:hypothetical protein